MCVSIGVEAPPAQRSLLLSEAPSPSAHLERPDVAADGRHARRVTPTGTLQGLLLKDRSSGDLHHTHAARRHRRSLNMRRVKAWTPAARSYKRCPLLERHPASMSCPCRRGSASLDDVGHATTAPHRSTSVFRVVASGCNRELYARTW